MNILLALLLSAIPPPPGVYANGYAPETIFMDGGLDMTGNAVFFDPTNSQVFLAWDAGSNGLDLTLGGSFLNVQGGPAVINNVEINGNQLPAHRRLRPQRDDQLQREQRRAVK
jgi:hypothetical protein